MSRPAEKPALKPNDLEAFWMPFTANRSFKKRPRILVRAKDMHYYTAENRAVLDGAAGMWCCNAGHNRDSIVAAIQAEAGTLDYAPPFQFAHPNAFSLASRASIVSRWRRMVALTASAIARGSVCAPPSGSGIISSITPNSSKS